MELKPTLDDLVLLSEGMDELPDTRPAWLRGLWGDWPHEKHPPYWRYLFEVARIYRPAFAVEIGTMKGCSAAHLAAGNPGGKVLTIDILPPAAWPGSDVGPGLSNVETVTSDSLEYSGTLKGRPPVDLLFIDGDHSFPRNYRDYLAYRPFVRDGGIILIDDALGDQAMLSFWERVVDPKAHVKLHYTGFGVAIKNQASTPAGL